mmetsp:Transcript_17679/g.26314  ORF Transcript_17679/g.26314 Transcript_17679/m.26314 type:complete len:813 (-) Transcript_17679:8-2446(-)
MFSQWSNTLQQAQPLFGETGFSSDDTTASSGGDSYSSGDESSSLSSDQEGMNRHFQLPESSTTTNHINMVVDDHVKKNKKPQTTLVAHTTNTTQFRCVITSWHPKDPSILHIGAATDLFTLGSKAYPLPHINMKLACASHSIFLSVCQRFIHAGHSSLSSQEKFLLETSRRYLALLHEQCALLSKSVHTGRDNLLGETIDNNRRTLYQQQLALYQQSATLWHICELFYLTPSSLRPVGFVKWLQFCFSSSSSDGGQDGVAGTTLIDQLDDFLAEQVSQKSSSHKSSSSSSSSVKKSDTRLDRARLKRTASTPEKNMVYYGHWKRICIPERLAPVSDEDEFTKRMEKQLKRVSSMKGMSKITKKLVASSDDHAGAQAADKDVVWKDGPDGRRIISAASLDRLIRNLADSTTFSQDKDYVAIMILTHREFLDSSAQLMQKLMDRYYSKPPPGMKGDELEEFQKFHMLLRLRITNVVKLWTTEFSYDFVDESLNQLFEKFTAEMSLDEHAKVFAERIRALLRQNRGMKIVQPKVPPILPSQKRSKKSGDALTLLDIHPTELARQLSLLDFKVFSRIRPVQLLRGSFSAKDKEKRAPDVVALINRFNRASYWAASEVVLQKRPKECAKAITHLILTMEELLDMNNFHSLMALFSGLSMTPVSRLKQSWALVKPKMMAIWNRCEEVLDPSKNFAKYRERLASANPPAIPFQGAFLTDLTFVAENAALTADGLINWEKMMIIGKVLLQIHRNQQEPYAFEIVRSIRNYLEHDHLCLGEKELYEKSYQLEGKKSKASSSSSGSSSKSDKNWFGSIRRKK